MINQKTYNKIMDSMLELNFTEKEGLVETSTEIYYTISHNIKKFNKLQVWLLSSRCSWLQDMVWRYAGKVI